MLPYDAAILKPTKRTHRFEKTDRKTFYLFALGIGYDTNEVT